MKNTKKVNSKDLSTSAQPLPNRSIHYFDNIAKITATLLASILALLTFLLVVGVQSSIKGFTTQLYAAIATLGASLGLYALGYVAQELYYASSPTKGSSKNLPSKILKATRFLQQVVFVASIATVVWFAITYAELLLNPKPVTKPAQPTSSQQGSPEAGQSELAPGETEEQHAKESQQSKPQQ